MSAVPPESPAHLGALTGIRGVAAWMVVLYHIRKSLILLLPADAIAVFAKGYLAVDLFFMLSGFVLWYSYADRIRQGGLAFAAPFLWRRLARIWPLHLFILALFIPLALLLRADGGHMLHYPFGELPLHVLLMQNWGMTQEIAWNQPAWSISTELAAYLLFPLTVCLARWERLPAPVLLGAACCCSRGCMCCSRSHGLGNVGQRHRDAWTVALPDRVCRRQSALHPVAALARQPHRRARRSSGGARRAGCGSPVRLAGNRFRTLVLCVTDCWPWRSVAGRWSGSSAAAACSISARSATRPICRTFCCSFCTSSLFVDASLQLGWAGLAGFLALVALSSVALYHGVEKPAQRWFNRNVPRWPKRAETVAARISQVAPGASLRHELFRQPKREDSMQLSDMQAKVGETIGTSEWYLLDQDRIDAFADTTEDHQFIHVDPETAKATPFGGTIAHGFLTLSMLAAMMEGWTSRTCRCRSTMASTRSVSSAR